MISIIVAMDSKRGIGKNNDLLFRIPEDFERMKRLTLGHPIIMGRKTFESIGRVLPGRTNIIITRDKKSFLNSHPEFISGSKILKQAFGSEAQARRVQNDNAVLASQGDALRGYVVGSLEEGIDAAKKSPGAEEIFIFGGGQVFAEALEKGLVDRLYLTIVEARLDSPPESPARRGDFGADTFFPDYSGFVEISKEDRSDENFKYSFLTLEKNS